MLGWALGLRFERTLWRRWNLGWALNKGRMLINENEGMNM